MALAPYFRRVVGVEINSRLVDAAKENITANGVTNGHVIHIPSEKFTIRQLKKPIYADTSPFEDLNYQFSVVLVDPPRAGLDCRTARLVNGFDHILYISCGPLSLLRDLQSGLGEGRDIERMAIFDHFPYPRHIECGVYLKRRKT